jgi:hypothetical protein
MNSRLPAFHDDEIIGFAVDCRSRELSLSIGHPEWKQDSGVHVVLFKNVQGYSLQHDAFGNIVLELSEIPIEDFLSTQGESLRESFRCFGAVGPWVNDSAEARTSRLT